MSNNTTLKKIFEEIAEKRKEQNNEHGGIEHDKLNSTNDWVAMITKHAGVALIHPITEESFRARMINIAGIAIAAIEVIDTWEGE